MRLLLSLGFAVAMTGAAWSACTDLHQAKMTTKDALADNQSSAVDTLVTASTATGERVDASVKKAR